MKEINKIVELIRIEPDSGKYLTQASLGDGEERVFSDSVYLPNKEVIDQWIEVDEQFKQAYDERNEKL